MASLYTNKEAFIHSRDGWGWGKVLLAVNKPDLVDYSKEVFDAIVEDFKDFCESALSLSEVKAVPISALSGVNVVDHSDKTPWYTGKLSWTT